MLFKIISALCIISLISCERRSDKPNTAINDSCQKKFLELYIMQNGLPNMTYKTSEQISYPYAIINHNKDSIYIRILGKCEERRIKYYVYCHYDVDTYLDKKYLNITEHHYKELLKLHNNAYVGIKKRDLQELMYYGQLFLTIDSLFFYHPNSFFYEDTSSFHEVEKKWGGPKYYNIY